MKMTMSSTVGGGGGEGVGFREPVDALAPCGRWGCVAHNMLRVRQQKRVLLGSEGGNPRLIIRSKPRLININNTNVISFSDF